MEPALLGIVGTCVLIALLLCGVHVGVALGVVGMAGFAALTNWTAGLGLLRTTPYSVTSHFTFFAIPVFILMGQFANYGGLSEDIYSVVHKWLGRVRGGLAMATTASCAAFAAACGSSVATAATFTQVALPEMLKFGYDRRLAAGAIAASGTLGALIPPSGLMIIYGIITEQSIGQLLMAGFIPGLLSALIYIGMISVWMAIRPNMAPVLPVAPPWRERFSSLYRVWGIAVLAVVVMGSIYTGAATPTEAGAFGAFGAFLLMILKGNLSGKSLGNALFETASSTTMLFTIIIGAFMFSRFLAITYIGPNLADFLLSSGLSRYLVLAGFLLLYVFLGMFMDPAAMMAISLPIVFPIVEQMGFSGIWFGVLVIKTCEIGNITPPVGLNVYTVHASAQGRVRLEEVFQGILPFFIMDVLTLAILVAFPQISLWLPQTMLG
ncbi:MAG: TRAP transporter large permease [Candidatus Binatia bacterium]